MNVLTPSGPFLLILWNPAARLCEVRGTLDDKELALEMLKRAKTTLDEHYQEQANKNLIERPRIHIVNESQN
jgi:hypothetical protein